MTTNEKLSMLREKMAEAGVQAYLIPSSDPHISEYLPDHWRARAWLSGFDGSAGTLVVTETESGLWTDGRYFIQAERQMAGSEIVLYRMKEKGVPTIQEFLLSRLKKGQVLGIDGMVTAAETVLDMETAFSAQGIGIRSEDLITPIWTDRPAIPQSPVYLLPEQYTGLSAAEKIAQVRSRLKENGADAMAITRLDSIAWLLNLRASDVVYNTSFVSYVLLTQETAVLYVDSSRVSEEALDYLKKNGVAVRPYGEILDGIAAIDVPTVMLVSVENVNYRLYLAMEENPRVTIVKGEEPAFCLKAVKNPVEIANTKNAHIKEGVAMARLQMCLEEKLAAGETVSETDVGELLVDFRKEQEGYMEDSFAVIAAYGANAAMMHYHPTPENHAVLQRKGFLLLDTGGPVRGRHHGYHPYLCPGRTDRRGTAVLHLCVKGQHRHRPDCLYGGLLRRQPGYHVPHPDLEVRSGLPLRHRPRRGLCGPHPRRPPESQDDQPCALPAGHDHHR